MLQSLRCLLGIALLSLLVVADAGAQITITESDVRATVGERIAIQQFGAQTPSNFQSIFNQSGTGQTFDVTPYTFRAVFSGIQDRWAVSEAPSDVPFLARFEGNGANVVSEIRFDAVDPTETDTTAWQFERVTSSEQEFVGFSGVFSEDVDGDGEAPDTIGAEWTPPRTLLQLPATFGDTWSQNTELSFFPVPLPSRRSGRESEIDAAGTLVTPAGSAPALRIRTETTDTTSLGPVEQVSRTTTLQFVTKDQNLAATITRNDDSGTITSATYTVWATEGSSFDVAQGETPSLDGPGVEVNFQQASSTAGALDVSRFDTAPFNNSFSGSAESDDGTSVSPNVLWKGQYFSIQNRGLEGFSAEVCIDGGPVPGISDIGKVVLLSRDASDQSWSPLSTTVSGNEICATVSSFSQFAVGSNSQYNTLPVELARFAAAAEGNTAILQWTTATETNNAGFHVEHRDASETTWSEVGFVEGTGTTTEAQSYRFRVSDLDPGRHRFRLRQVDTDGTTHLSDVVRVQTRLQNALRLTAPTPNPVRQQATLQFGVRESQATTVAVYDVLGRRVATLYDGTPPAGRMQEVRLSARDLPSGVYFVRMASGAKTKTRRVTVVQ